MEQPEVVEVDAAPVDQPAVAVVADSAPVLTIQIPSVDDAELSEDEAVLLLKAKAGDVGAEKARHIKAMLLS